MQQRCSKGGRAHRVMVSGKGALYPCPCCGYLVFEDPPGSAMSCPVCGWEDDYVQLLWPTDAGGANRLSLQDSQQAFIQHGTSDLERRPPLHRNGPTYRRDAAWRPFDLSRDRTAPPREIRGGREVADFKQLYYWSRSTPSDQR